MTVAELCVQAMIDNGMDQLYCLPGVQNDDFFDALYDRQSELVPIHARHEQSTVYMALGAAMATGKPQAFNVVPGPGFLNTTAALSTAYAVNAPLFGLIGQIPLGAVGKGFGLLHEIPDQLAIMRGLMKQADRITGGDDAADVLTNALRAMQSGRPRPVGVEVSMNIWKSPVEARPESLAVERDPGPRVDTDAIDRAAALLRTAEAPLIIVGSGAMAHGAEVKQLSDMTGAPVVAFRSGHGVINEAEPLSISMPVAHDLWDKLDVVIGLGTRMQIQRMGWGMDEDLKVIHIDIDPEEITRIQTPAVGIEADLGDALPLLLAALEGSENTRPDWQAKVQDTKARFAQRYAETLGPQLAYLSAIRDVLPPEGILVDELTQVGYVSRFAYPTLRPRTYLSTGYQGTLGWGYATALGAAHARRDVPVVGISGDGGALYTLTEMATAVRHSIPLTFVVFNDNAFGNVRRFQIDNYEGRAIASDLTSPDFAAMAESFGVRGVKAEGPEGLRSALTEAIKSGGPSLIEVPVGEFPSPWPYVLMPQKRGAQAPGRPKF